MRDRAPIPPSASPRDRPHADAWPGASPDPFTARARHARGRSAHPSRPPPPRIPGQPAPSFVPKYPGGNRRVPRRWGAGPHLTGSPEPTGMSLSAVPLCTGCAQPVDARCTLCTGENPAETRASAARHPPLLRNDPQATRAGVARPLTRSSEPSSGRSTGSENSPTAPRSWRWPRRSWPAGTGRRSHDHPRSSPAPHSGSRCARPDRP